MKVLIIGQWIYPYITPRANRTWELAKGFANEGHDVTVYALLGDRDYSYEEKKFNMKIKSLGRSMFGMIDSQGRGNRNIIYRAIAKIIGEYNAFPGCEFYPMIKNCFKQEHDIDLLITIAHPHVIHWATAKYIDLLKPNYWIADCGDPFMGNAFYHPNMIFKRFEVNFCSRANFILVPIKEAIQSYYPEFKDKIFVVPQGFDNSEIVLSKYVQNKVPLFAFAGATYKNKRDPQKFLNYLANYPYKFRFIVYSDSPEFIDYAGVLSGKLEIRNKVPRKELIYEISKCDFLINISNGTSVQSPSKLIDYGLANRPILTISSEFTADEQDKFINFVHGDYSSKEEVDITMYEITNIVKSILGLLNHMEL